MTAAELSRRVRDAAARQTPLRITGAGTWLDAGRPVRAAETLSVATCAGVSEYVPGDLTLTAGAGTSLDEIARVTAAEGQWLAMDPPGAGRGTIGAVIATASAGPLAHAYGTPRDAVLGIEAITGDGDVVRGGGRVVKNVAGFDLTRLLTGAWGTLGVITEVSLRLRARPEFDVTMALELADDSAVSLTALLARLRAAALAPLALEIVNPQLASLLGLGHRTIVLARLAGNAESVRAQQDAFGALGATTTAAADVWPKLAACEPPGAAVIRLSRRPSMLPEVWRIAREAVAGAAHALLHAPAGRGIVRCILPSADLAIVAALLASAARAKCAIVGERLPASCWQDTALPAPADDVLSRRARDAFDPRRILNPGILSTTR